jgi:hypothetical protein
MHALSDKVIALTPEGWKVRGTFEAHEAVLPAGAGAGAEDRQLPAHTSST